MERGECLYILNQEAHLWKGSARLLITVCWSILQRGRRREREGASFLGQESARRVKTVYQRAIQIDF